MIALAQVVDRWTCPTCHVTEVPRASDKQLHAAIRRAQERHAQQHARALAAALASYGETS